MPPCPVRASAEPAAGGCSCNRPSCPSPPAAARAQRSKPGSSRPQAACYGRPCDLTATATLEALTPTAMPHSVQETRRKADGAAWVTRASRAPQDKTAPRADRATARRSMKFLSSILVSCLAAGTEREGSCPASDPRSTTFARTSQRTLGISPAAPGRSPHGGLLGGAHLDDPAYERVHLHGHQPQCLGAQARATGLSHGGPSRVQHGGVLSGRPPWRRPS